MAEVVNLRAARKAKAKDAARIKGAEIAAKFGQSKADKSLQKARAEKAARDLDGAKREE